VIHFFQIDFLFLNINFKKTLFFIKNYPYFWILKFLNLVCSKYFNWLFEEFSHK
jgi:hypothetical protein